MRSDLPGQKELPETGITKAREIGRLRRLSWAPLKPKAPQEPCDIGLFSDSAKQIDLMDCLGTLDKSKRMT